MPANQPSGRGAPAIPVQARAYPSDPPDKTPRTNATTAAYAASVRGVTAQAVAFYFRAPVKAFFRTRVDYLAHVRAIILEEERLRELAATSSSPGAPASSPTSPASRRPRWVRSLHSTLRSTTPVVLASAVRKFGWRILPDHVLPPLVANVAVGAVLYTSYLQVLARLHEPSAQHRSLVYPPPPPASTATAGFVAGGLQSLVAAPLDAIQARYDVQGAASGGPAAAAGVAERRRSMWAFSVDKLREIGLRGMFAGWGLSFVKDGFGSALFFGTFEYVKAQGYYRFVEWYYGSLTSEAAASIAVKRPAAGAGAGATEYAFPDSPGFSALPAPSATVIRPHYALEPAFLLLAGVAAGVVQQVVVHPLTHVQTEHWAHLEGLDVQAARLRARPDKYPKPRHRQGRMLRAYVHAYRETWAQCRTGAATAGLGMARWVYRGFWWATIRQVPSTSAGLIIFELVRRRYGFKGDQVRIPRDDYDIIIE